MKNESEKTEIEENIKGLRCMSEEKSARQYVCDLTIITGRAPRCQAPVEFMLDLDRELGKFSKRRLLNSKKEESLFV